MEIVLTTEGLYLASAARPGLPKTLPVLDKFDTFADTRGLFDLALADEDFRAFDLVDDEKKTLLKECNTFVSLLKIFSVSNDEFIRINDFKNDELVLYSAMGQIFRPRCDKVESISLTQSDGCYKDIPVNFTLGKAY